LSDIGFYAFRWKGPEPQLQPLDRVGPSDGSSGDSVSHLVFDCLEHCGERPSLSTKWWSNARG
jgi:hypothetical protein